MNLSSYKEYFVEIREGSVCIIGPNLKLFSDGNRIEPNWAPVFYNPAMKIDRDISVCVLLAFQKLTKKELRICEALSATGVRGLRYAKEVDGVKRVVLNDVNRLAYELIRMNILKNDLSSKAIVFHADANTLLSYFARRGRRFNVVDVDPFGSPVPFLDNAIRAVENKGLLCITATDLAPLMGVYRRACVRKYGAFPMRIFSSQEIGLRILIGFIVRTAAKYAVGIKPLLSYYRRHYMRVFAFVRIGKKTADESLSKIGYLAYCPRCGHVYVERKILLKEHICGRCKKKMEISGPLWLGKLGAGDFIRVVLKSYQTKKDYFEREVFNLLDKILGEIDLPPYFYTTDHITRMYKFKREPPLKDIINELRRLGFEASLTHFANKGFKTNAHIDEIVKVFRMKLQNL